MVRLFVFVLFFCLYYCCYPSQFIVIYNHRFFLIIIQQYDILYWPSWPWKIPSSSFFFFFGFFLVSSQILFSIFSIPCQIQNWQSPHTTSVQSLFFLLLLLLFWFSQFFSNSLFNDFFRTIIIRFIYRTNFIIKKKF